MKLTIDFETRSACDLKKTNPWVYAEDPSTDVQCLALMADDSEPYLWAPRRLQHIAVPLIKDANVVKALEVADEIEAHNAEFEISVWHHVMHKRYGFPDLPIEKMRCSAAKAAVMALPRALGKAAEALGLPQKKDNYGHGLMMKMCRPRDRKATPMTWWEDPNDFKRLFEYCLQDVRTEVALSRRLKDLSEVELKVWQLDQLMNRRGTCLDRQACLHMIDLIDQHSIRLLNRFRELTGGRVMTPKQVEKLKDLLRDYEGLDLDDLTKRTVKNALQEDTTSPVAKEILQIRQSLGKASTAKYNAALRCCSKDGRVRSLLMYHGASTGRWTGKGAQIQNYPREVVKEAAEVFTLPTPQAVEQHTFAEFMFVAAGCLRATWTASPGKQLYVADFASIEGRVLAWLANEQWCLDAYNRNEDMYCLAAAAIYGRPIDKKKDPVERQIGKVAELALGYQGSVGAFNSMAANYGVCLPDDKVKEIVLAWRKARPKTARRNPQDPGLWMKYEQAAIACMGKPGTIITVKGAPGADVAFCFKHPWFMVRLPSGRILWYYDPEIHEKHNEDGYKRQTFTFMGVDPTTKKWDRESMYGGIWAENIDQGISRDIMAWAMLRAEKARYEMLFTVHDELVSEKANGDIKEFVRIVEERPDWCKTCPIKAEGFTGFRYGKG